MIRFNGSYPATDDSIILLSAQISPIPKIVAERVAVPGRAGMLQVSRQHAERTIRLNYELNGKSAQHNAQLMRALALWAESSAPKRLIADELPDRFFLAQLESIGAPDLADAFPEVELTFFCADPYGYALEESTGAVGAAVTNSGDVAVKPVITFAAANNYTGASWSCGGRTISLLSYPIQAGHTIVIDCAAGVITDNGASDAIMQALSLTSDWLELAPGSNTITGPGGTVKWRTTWL